MYVVYLKPNACKKKNYFFLRSSYKFHHLQVSNRPNNGFLVDMSPVEKLGQNELPELFQSNG